MTAAFELKQVGKEFDGQPVLQDVTLEVSSREFLAICGPNGAGKSTVLSIMAGLTAPSRGTCSYLGRPVRNWGRREFAREVAVLMISEPLAFPFAAREVVAMGRILHSSAMLDNPADALIVNSAMLKTETLQLRDRDFRTLSAGEKQRVLLASALAQEPRVLLLDEPAAHLDLEHQLSLHQLLRRMADGGLVVVAVSHDLNLAAAYADRLAIVAEGRLQAHGTPEEVLQPELIRRVFRVEAERHEGASGKPWLTYHSLSNALSDVPHGAAR